MAKEKAQGMHDYDAFAALHDKSDDAILAFVQKHGCLGLDPRNPTGVSWGYQGVLTQPGIGLVFIPWERRLPVCAADLAPMTETPATIKQEAQKMHLFIQILNVLGECTDAKGRLVFEEAAKRRFEISDLSEKLQHLWPGTILLTSIPIPTVWPPANPDAPDMASVEIPDINWLMNCILSRVRLRVSRDQSSLRRNSLPFSNEGYRFALEESCLLAKLWYELLSKVIRDKSRPRICPYCNELFMPDRPDQEYHPWCQERAKKHRQRERKAADDGRELRPTVGRPPRKKRG